MSKKQLNSLVSRYQTTKSDDIFSELYVELRRQVLPQQEIQRIHQTRQLDSHEIISIFDTCLMNILPSYNESIGDFVNYFRKAFLRRQVDRMRKKRTITDHEVLIDQTELTDDESNLSSYFTRLPDETDIEADFIRQEEIRSLMKFITDPGKVGDETTIKIISEIREYQPPEECRSVGRPKSIFKAIAPKVGVSEKTMRRKLKRLAGSLKVHGLEPEYL